MKQHLSNYLANFSVKEQNLNTLKLFKYILLGWLFFHTVMLLPYGDLVWGPNAYKLIDFSFTDIRKLGVLLYDPQIIPYYLWFIGAQLVVIVLAIFDIWPRAMMVILFLINNNLNTKALYFTSGGTTMVECLLAYLIFVNTTGIKSELNTRFSKLKITLHNLFFLILRLQIVALYAWAMYSKFQDPIWSSGLAVYYIFQSQFSAQPWMKPLFSSFPLLAIVGVYVTEAFQFLFPFFIWFKRFSPYLILVGVGLHLMMAYGMGLFFFGTLMSIVYLLFFEDSWAQKVFSFFKKDSEKEGPELSPVYN